MKNYKEKVNLGIDNYLKIEPSNFKRKYGVLIKFNDDKGKEKGLITYEIEVIAQKTDMFLWLYNFDKKNVRINDQKPHKNLDVIATECNLALYPIQLEVGWKHNKKQIKNSGKIRANWNKKKEILNNRFAHELVNWYLKTTDKNIEDDTLLHKAIEHDIFLCFYLTPIYQTYGMLTNMTETEIKIPILPNTLPVTFLSELKINHEVSSYGTITLKMEGILNEERSAYDLVTLKDIPVTPSNENKNGRMEATFQLDKNSKIIKSIISDCFIELPYGKGRSFRMEAFEI
ncbi:hypothetical protein [Pseudozobellia thermophila]|uniref:Uncharacterized protein n=1 Tax=Pseudozobellia thermophila TaxID=192903 RepID=A0A1M6PFI8_9FLAO|nr:hypothetical protein [Pseudozobellia thermophila]SHK06728.1 hypothetical protein SAMN04488513_1212 [Pseudozobellia thermophila]